MKRLRSAPFRLLAEASVRQRLVDQADTSMGRLVGGEAQGGGARFAKDIAGTDQPDANLGAVVGTLPNGRFGAPRADGELPGDRHAQAAGRADRLSIHGPPAGARCWRPPATPRAGPVSAGTTIAAPRDRTQVYELSTAGAS